MNLVAVVYADANGQQTSTSYSDDFYAAAGSTSHLTAEYALLNISPSIGTYRFILIEVLDRTDLRQFLTFYHLVVPFLKRV